MMWCFLWYDVLYSLILTTHNRSPLLWFLGHHLGVNPIPQLPWGNDAESYDWAIERGRCLSTNGQENDRVLYHKLEGLHRISTGPITALREDWRIFRRGASSARVFVVDNILFDLYA